MASTVAGQRADLQPGGSSAVARKTSQVIATRERGGQDAELGLLQLRAAEARVAIRMETVKPIPAIVPVPVTRPSRRAGGAAAAERPAATTPR
jgi:hypothetical protein